MDIDEALFVPRLARRLFDGLFDDPVFPIYPFNLMLKSPTPIHRMPAEVLTYIFDLAVHTSCSSAQYDEGDTLESKPGITSHPTNALTPLKLSHICKTWRDIIFSSPELWSTIYITNASTRQYALLDLWMKNAKAIVGSYSLFDDDSSTSSGPPMTLVFRDAHGYRYKDALAMIHMLRVASVHCHRWKSLSFIIRRNIYMNLDMNLYQNLITIV